jgi:hypothetical protein
MDFILSNSITIKVRKEYGKQTDLHTNGCICNVLYKVWGGSSFYVLMVNILTLTSVQSQFAALSLKPVSGIVLI